MIYKKITLEITLWNWDDYMNMQRLLLFWLADLSLNPDRDLRHIASGWHISVQLLQVMNSSQNLPIYLCVGTSFKNVLRLYAGRYLSCLQAGDRGQGKEEPNTQETLRDKTTVISSERGTRVWTLCPGEFNCELFVYSGKWNIYLKLNVALKWFNFKLFQIDIKLSFKLFFQIQYWKYIVLLKQEKIFV